MSEDITESDIYEWLDEEFQVTEHYDPRKHIIAELFAERYGRSISWARRSLRVLVKKGRLKQVTIIMPSGNTGIGYERVTFG